MIRCIYCGLCEEVCPEQAIFLKKEYSITGYTREEMVHKKEKLYEMGGVMEGLVYKWNEKKYHPLPAYLMQLILFWVFAVLRVRSRNRKNRTFSSKF
jgi:formate hydrogenlyase subunit 6/NADH:ubiquinone oxidoreductase subunit I